MSIPKFGGVVFTTDGLSTSFHWMFHQAASSKKTDQLSCGQQPIWSGTQSADCFQRTQRPQNPSPIPVLFIPDPPNSPIPIPISHPSMLTGDGCAEISPRDVSLRLVKWRSCSFFTMAVAQMAQRLRCLVRSKPPISTGLDRFGFFHSHLKQLHGRPRTSVRSSARPCLQVPCH